MHYVSAGQGDAVVLIHGLFGNLDNLKNLGMVLEKQYQVIRVDVPNHGASEHWDNMDYAALSQAMISLLDKLNLNHAHFVGHSMGGKIAMATAQNNPKRVRSLVVADIAPVRYQPRHDMVFNALQSLPLMDNNDRKSALTHLINSHVDAATAQFLLKNLQRTDRGFRWKMNLTGLHTCYPKLIGWDNQDKCYTGPSLFIRGADSDYVTHEHKEAILQQFPLAQAKTLEGCGHWLHAQKPAIFNRIVADFINQHPQ